MRQQVLNKAAAGAEFLLDLEILQSVQCRVQWTKSTLTNVTLVT